MNSTLKKYELMKELEIEVLGFKLQDWLVYDGDGTWYERGNVERTIKDLAVAAILERACREWLEEMYCSVEFYGEDEYMMNGQKYSSYDDAQIEALKHCLKKLNK